MKVLDAELDSQPTAKKVREFAELRIENLLCFKELQSFNNTGKWVYEHPLVRNEAEVSKLKELRYKEPHEFLRKYNNCCYNIKRYSSFLKREDRVDKRLSDKANLKKYKDLAVIFKNILEDED
ncbi:MAG: hypothetical protein DBY00_06995 [Flavobacteriales bacterium]|nr:MAG: hypothetical protein DBY00_06995 [Flavobacteriales bacterium]